MKKKDRKQAKVLLQAVLDIFKNPKWKHIDNSNIVVGWDNALHGWTIDELTEEIESLLGKKSKEIVLEPNCKYQLKYTGAYCSLGSRLMIKDDPTTKEKQEVINSCNWLFISKIDTVGGLKNIFYASELNAYLAFDADRIDYVIKKVF